MSMATLMVKFFDESKGGARKATPTVKKKWLRNNIFCFLGGVNGQECTSVIEVGASTILSQALVDRLQTHTQSYFVLWLMIGNAM